MTKEELYKQREEEQMEAVRITVERGYYKNGEAIFDKKCVKDWSFSTNFEPRADKLAAIVMEAYHDVV